MYAAPDLLMLGATATSATCCVAPAARASRRARALSVAMVLVMTVVTLAPGMLVQYAGAVLVLVLAGLLVTGPGPDGQTGPGETDWHRGIGAILMALAVLVHAASMGRMGSMAGMHHAADWNDSALLLGVLLVKLPVAAYLCWTAATLVRRRRPPLTDLVRWEHAAMAASLVSMAYLMS